MRLPAYDTLEGLLFAYLLCGGEVTSFSWNEQTGKLNANQRFGGLKRMGLPVKSKIRNVSWNKRPIAFYSLEPDFLKDFAERKDDYIKAAEKHWGLTIKKGVNPKATPYRVGQTTEASNDYLR